MVFRLSFFRKTFLLFLVFSEEDVAPYNIFGEKVRLCCPLLPYKAIDTILSHLKNYSILVMEHLCAKVLQ